MTRPSLTSPRRAASALVAYPVLVVIGLFFLAPLTWLVLASVNSSATLAVSLPRHPTMANFSAVLTGGGLLRPLLNSALLSGGATVFTMVAAALAAYPLSRYTLRFHKSYLYTILFATGLPVTAIMVPVYELFVQFNLVDSRVAAALFLSATTLPFAIWLMKNFMDGVPVELEQAAWVDGASGMASLRRVVLPLMLPGAAVAGIFTFILAWGNFFVPFILLLSPGKAPASVTIFQFFSQYGQVAYGQLAAYSILYSAPVIALYAVVQRVFGNAFSLAGAVRG